MKNVFAERKYFIGSLIGLVGLVLAIKLFNIQVLDDSYKESADNNAQRRIISYPARGLILDRNGKIIVSNEIAYDLMVIPKETSAFDTASFAELLGVEFTDIAQMFTNLRKDPRQAYSARKPMVYMRQMNKETYARLQETLHRYPGFFVQARTLRKYERKIAPHLLGYVAEVDTSDIRKDNYYRQGDYIGRSGIEAYYEKELRGQKGVKISLVDVHNRVVGPYRNGELDANAVVGKDLNLTIDADLQEYGEHLMDKMRGAAVVIEPQTGEILAMISKPGYDPSLLVGRVRGNNYMDLLRKPNKPLFDRSVMAFYPPGSTFKLAQALIGLETHAITAQTHIGCSHGYVVGNFRMGCHGHASPLTLTNAIATSCNAFFASTFRSVLDNKKTGTIEQNYAAWREGILRFGFGDRLGVDLPQELTGNVPTPEYYQKRFFSKESWRSLRLVSLGIGQGELGCTILQLANFTAMIANKGKFYTPHLLKKVDGRDTVPAQAAYIRHSGIEESYFDLLHQGMYGAVYGGMGTAHIAAIPGITVCGKTGTAQNPHGLDHSTFVAFAPKENPKIAVAVFIENAGFGGTWAAPIASLLIEKYLNGEVARPELEQYILGFNKYDSRQ